MKKYLKYKDCGMEWIGVVPEHWTVYRGSRLGNFYKGSGIKKDEVKSDGVACIRYGEIYTSYDMWFKETKSFIEPALAEESFPILKGDLLFAASGETKEDIGKCVVYVGTQHAVAGGDIIILRPNKFVDPRYASFLMNSNAINVQKTLLSKGEIIVHLYSKHLREIIYPIPPIAEQRSISTYLDNKCAQIDDLIKKKEELVRLLELKRQAMINEAVTKGLNPKAKMKDSGVEWIGEVPEGWEVIKLKNIVKLNNLELNVESESSKLRIALENIESHTGKLISNKEHNGAFEGKGNAFKAGDVLFNKLRPYLAKVYLAKSEGISVGELLVLSPDKKNLTSDFLYFRLISSSFIEHVNSSTYGAKMPRANWTFIGDQFICLPSKDEQLIICQHLENQINLNSRIIDDIYCQIDKLKEYKKSLIYEVVTGKVDVR